MHSSTPIDISPRSHKLAHADYFFALLGIFSISFVVWLNKGLFRKKNNPPGPKGDWLLGHVRWMKVEHSWLWYTELKEKYGDVVSISALGSPMILLGSWDAVNDLLVKKGSIYSDRPDVPMTTKVLGLDKVVSLSPYGPNWKEQRRLFHTYLSKDLVKERYWDIIEHEAKMFVTRTLNAASNPYDEYRLTSLKTLLESAYGLKINSLEDDLVKSSLQGGDIASHSALPGRFLVNVFPTLLHVPSWFPGAGWKKQGKIWEKLVRDMNEVPYNAVKKAEAEGRPQQPNFTLDCLRAESNLDDDWMLQTIGTMYMAGSDTTIALVQEFILAMVKNPEIQKRAQEEVDRVVMQGQGRLPSISDQEDLPFIDACLKEAMRWRPVSPIAVPRRLMEDDTYRGCLLPRGALVIANVWAISQDVSLYTNPTEFIPDRFLGKNPALDPRLYSFGAGRRICPGMLFAEQSAFITLATMLATVDIVPALDEKGEEMSISLETTGRFMNSPVPFECRFNPRNETALTMLKDAV